MNFVRNLYVENEEFEPEDGRTSLTSDVISYETLMLSKIEDHRSISH